MNDAASPPPILRQLRPADAVSLLNGLVGLAAVAAAAEGRFTWAFGLILAAVLIDGVDGAVARFGGAGPLGGILDTLSDLVAFVVAPTMLMFVVFGYSDVVSMGGSSSWPSGVLGAVLAAALCALYAVCGLLRLARFEWLKGGTRADYFVGLTTPGAALWAAGAALWVSPATDGAGPAVLAAAVVLGASLLMVARLRLPKLRGPLVLPSILVILASIGLAFTVAPLAPILLFLFGAAYLLYGSAYVRRRERGEKTAVAA